MVQELVGRRSELALASQMLDTARADPVALILDGVEGIGKTTLWKAILAEAEERGYRVLSARPVESEAMFGFSAVADLLRDDLDEAVTTLPEPQRAALAAALLRIDSDGAPDPKAVAFGLHGSLVALSRTRPLVVGVDDVRCLDPASARVLGFALRRLEDVPVGVLLASRADGSGPGHESLLELDASALGERIHRIHLEPLGPNELRQILRSRLDVRFPKWVLDQIHDASGGNPLVALELARALARRGIDGGPGQALEVPQRLAELVNERLGSLSLPVRRMLMLVAASPRPTLPDISRALGDPPSFHADVDAAGRADVIEVIRDRMRFTNPLFGTVIYSDSSSGERRQAHRLLADVASDPEERARHLALAADGPDEQVAQVLEDAAQRARSHGAPEAAAQLAELSRTLTPPVLTHERIRRTAHAGRYAFESAQIERAEELLQQAAGASEGPMRAEALLYLSRVHYHRRDTRSASSLAEDALREAAADPSLEASINLELAAAAELSGDHRAATTRARRALRLAERSGDRTITAEALSVCGFYDFVSGKGISTDTFERASSIQGAGPPVRPLRSPAFHQACVMMWSDDLPGARTRLHELAERARDTGDEGSLSVLLSLLSQIDSWAGDWVTSATLADEAGEVAEWTGQRVYLILARYVSALLESLKGNVDRATALSEESLLLAQQTGSVQPGEYARSVLGFLELSRGDARAAHGWLSELVRAMHERGPVDPGMLRFLPDEVEALIGSNEVEQAQRLLVPFEARARALNRSWALGSAARCRGLVLAARRELEGAVEAFDRALELQRDLGQPLEVGRTYLARGIALRRSKRWAPARDSLHRALQVFDDLGARLWTERARSELSRIGGRPPNLSQLTETEDQVAELVASGLTNREVAARLFLSLSTVESNLRRAYRKLGVRSRAELSHKFATSRSSERT
jgi:DNA-binding CsgD family transcriptional regulator